MKQVKETKSMPNQYTGRKIGAVSGFFVGAVASTAVSLLVNGYQEFLLNIFKDFIFNNPIGLVVMIAAASTLLTTLVGLGIGYLVDRHYLGKVPTETDEDSEIRLSVSYSATPLFPFSDEEINPYGNFFDLATPPSNDETPCSSRSPSVSF